MNIFKQRLLKLADFLDTVPNERFMFGRWVDEGWGGKPDLSCGAPACSLGWATTIPEFQELGMCLGRDMNVQWGNFYTVALKGQPFSASTNSALKAAEHVFGVSEKEFDFLFIPKDESEDNWEFTFYDRYCLERECSPKDAADHIRHFAMNKYPD